MSEEDDDLCDVFLGPPSQSELEKAQQTNRRHTLLELPSPVSRRVASMAMASFVIVPPDPDAEPPTPARVFEIASPSFDRFQVRRHNALAREIAALGCSSDEEEEEERRGSPLKVRSFVRVPSPAPFETVEAVEEQIGEAVCATMETVETGTEQCAVPCREGTPARGRVAQSGKGSRESGAARERAMRLAELLAERAEVLVVVGNKATVRPHLVNDLSRALAFLTDEQKQRVAGVVGG